MSGDPSSKPRLNFFGGRYSKSAEESRRAEIERIKAMTPLERMGMALALGRRRRALAALRSETKR